MNEIELIRQAIKIEADAVNELVHQVDDTFSHAIELIRECTGKIVVTGVGKSGIVGKKIAATLSSTGTPAFFVHSTEGVHGDSGMIQETDVVILISNSGETKEVLSLVPILDQVGCHRISITSNHSSTLARLCDVSLAYSYEREADQLNLAPTTSATLTLVIGDALATTLSVLRGFDKEDFHRYHPGGSLGEQLLVLKNRVSE